MKKHKLQRQEALDDKIRDAFAQLTVRLKYTYELRLDLESLGPQHNNRSTQVILAAIQAEKLQKLLLEKAKKEFPAGITMTAGPDGRLSAGLCAKLTPKLPKPNRA
ncbi:MAG: hypothetical protein HY548_02945 [Elusimicrobia bacterium]|nr:hypothetical protein [Elusimicrobiota bacterium]